MKKYFYLFASIPLAILSCNQEEIMEKQNDVVKPSNEVTKIPSKSFLWDGIYEIRDGKEVDLTHTQNSTRASSTHQFYEIATISGTSIYPGSVITAQSINEGSYENCGFPNEIKEEVTISFSLPVRSKTIRPRKSDFTNAIIDAIGDKNFTGRQSQVFTYRMKEFSYYSEVKFAFGANVNIGQIFGINTSINKDKIKYNTALYVDFSQTYFTVDMDIPDDGNIYRTEAIRQSHLYQNPVYVNSVNYGRKGVIMVESTYSYSALSVAIRAAFNAKIVNGSLDLDYNTKKILQEAEINICILGGDAYESVKTIKGFNEFQEFIVKGGVYTNQVYGIPISFGGAYAKNNAMFVSEFQINY